MIYIFIPWTAIVWKKISFEEAYAVASETANNAAIGDYNKETHTVLLLRPFQTYNMASGILMKGGLETGFTAHGHHDFQLTDDVIHKVHIGHYTFYHKSVVKQPKNLVIAQDIFAHSYVGGEGTSFFRTGDDQANTGPNSFVDELQNDRFTSSLIPLIVPVGRGGVPGLKNPIDITGHYNPQTLDETNSQLDDSKEHYPGASKYAAALNFNALQNYGSSDTFLSPLRHLNTVCFQGHQVSRGPSGAFDKITINTGHWGPNVYAGCRAVRNGENGIPQRYGIRETSRLSLNKKSLKFTPN